MPKGRLNNPNAAANLTAPRFEPGASGNPGGSRSAGAHVLEYVNTLCREDDGKARFSPAELRKWAEAPETDKRVPIPKRLAASLILACLEGRDRKAREWLRELLDRTTGKPTQQVRVDHASVQRAGVRPRGRFAAISRRELSLQPLDTHVCQPTSCWA